MSISTKSTLDEKNMEYILKHIKELADRVRDLEKFKKDIEQEKEFERKKVAREHQMQIDYIQKMKNRKTIHY